MTTETLQSKLSTEFYNVPTVQSHEFLKYANAAGPSYFQEELDCTLKNSNGLIQITDYSSDLHLEEILDVLPVQDIELVEISLAQKRVNANVSFFNMDIRLPGGTIRLLTHWNMWQDIRSEELVRGMLVPLYLAKLEEKVMFDGGLILLQKPEKVIRDFLDAAAKDIPNQFHPKGANGEQKLAAYAFSLETAGKIASNELEDIPLFIAEQSVMNQKIWQYQQVVNGHVVI